MTGITLVATIVFGRNPRCHLDAIVQFTSTKISPFLVHGQMTIIFVVSVGWFVCAEFCLSRLWSDFDQTWTCVICLGL